MLNHDMDELRVIIKAKDEEIERVQTYSMHLTNDFEIVKQKLSASRTYIVT